MSVSVSDWQSVGKAELSTGSAWVFNVAGMLAVKLHKEDRLLCLAAEKRSGFYREEASRRGWPERETKASRKE